MFQKGFTPILIILSIVLLLGVAGGAYYFGKSSAKLPTSPSQVSVPTSQVSVFPTPQSVKADETANPDLIGANWKTYINSKHRFQVKYPENIEVQFMTDAQGKQSELPVLYNKEFVNSPGIYFFVFDNSSQTEIKAFVENSFEEGLKESEKNNTPPPQKLENGTYVTISGITGYQGTKFGFDSEKLVTYLAGGNYVIEVSFDDSNSNFEFTEENKQLFLKILSTFKFLP